jgi:hypothetical protein
VAIGKAFSENAAAIAEVLAPVLEDIQGATCGGAAALRNRFDRGVSFGWALLQQSPLQSKSCRQLQDVSVFLPLLCSLLATMARIRRKKKRSAGHRLLHATIRNMA